MVIDKREHIGGNCYDYIDEHGIRTSLYGVHIFHTKYDRVKNYVQQFSEWIPYEHRVVAKAHDTQVTRTRDILIDSSIHYLFSIVRATRSLSRCPPTSRR